MARIFVIPTDRVLSQEEQVTVSSHLSRFFDQWDSHGRKVVARSVIEHDRFVVVSAFVPGDHVSGCGIDASDHQLNAVADIVGFSRAPVLDVFYLSDKGVRNVSRLEFTELAQKGDVSTETTVFDTSISTAADWKRGRFARPVAEMWHAQAFF